MELLGWAGLAWRVRWGDKKGIHVDISADLASSTADPTASAIITADLQDGVALNSEVIVLIIGEAGEVVTDGRLLAQLELDWRVQQAPTLVVDQVVS